MKGILLPLLLLAVLVAPTAARGQERVVIRAEPEVRISASRDEASRTELTASGREQNAVMIVERDGRYFWASREDREVVHVVSGVYHFYIDPTGGGYVKVLDQRRLSRGMKLEGPDIQFRESVGLGLTTLTYWGSAVRFAP